MSGEKGNNNLLKQSLLESKTSKDIQKETISILQKAEIIKNKLKDYNQEIGEEVAKQYNEVREKTIISLKNDQIINQQELNDIKKELSDIQKIDFSIKLEKRKKMRDRNNNKIRNLKVEKENNNIRDIENILQKTSNISTLDKKLIEKYVVYLNEMNDIKALQKFGIVKLKKILSITTNNNIERYKKRLEIELRNDIEKSDGRDNVISIIINKIFDDKNSTNNISLIIRDYYKNLGGTIKDYEKICQYIKVNPTQKYEDDIYVGKDPIGIGIINDENKNHTSESILQRFKEFEKIDTYIEDIHLRKYIKEEIKRLKKGGEKTNWSIFLLTLIERKGFKYTLGKLALGQGKRAHNAAQDKLIYQITGDTKGFGNDFIQGYSSDMSNYLIKTQDFKDKIASTEMKDMNSRALGNYFLYLQSENKLSEDDLKNAFGEEKLMQLGELWKDAPTGEGAPLAKRALENAGLGYVITFIKLFRSENINDFEENLSKITEKDREEMINRLRNKESKEYKTVSRILKDSLKDSNKNRKEKQEIINNVIEKLIEGESNILSVLSEFEKKNEIEIQEKDIDNIVQSAQNIKDAKLKQKILDSKTKPEEKKKYLKAIKKVRKEQELFEVLSSTNKRTIIDNLKEGRKYEDIINELRKEHKEIDRVLQKQEEEENSQQDNEKQNNTTSILQEADFIKTSTGDYMIPSPINKEKTITITLKEKELIQKSPEAEKNLIDFIKVTDENGLNFLWEHRDAFINIMNEKKGNDGIENTDDNFIDKAELTKLLNFTLELIGESVKNSTYEQVIATIKQINEIGVNNNKKDTLTGLSIIGSIFYKRGYINLGDKLSTKNITNIQDEANRKTLKE